MGHSLLPFTEVFGWVPLYGSTGHAINSKARHRPFLFLLPLVRGREILTERLSHTPNGGGGGIAGCGTEVRELCCNAWNSKSYLSSDPTHSDLAPEKPTCLELT